MRKMSDSHIKTTHQNTTLYSILAGNLGGNRYRDGKSENDREGVVCLSARVFKKLSFYTGWVARRHASFIS
ncbi:hypothetical protein LaPh949_gp090 [Lactococcus phage 949]|uniref:Uncharacterized protein n=1 Tax=Lactococcus phage 949 TaxID=881953 RepID=E0YIX7_9CAUD|nr:hypothetical protein LaPh949_gp090 [Lactococcus phage 949]ADM73648.1 hypothetical protein [Lactococcus phage 949]